MDWMANAKTIKPIKTMITGKELKTMVSCIPDDAGVTINGNWDVNVVNVKVETHFDGWLADLQLTQGYSITKDSVLDGLFRYRHKGSSTPDAETR